MQVKLYIYQDATIYNEVEITADNTLISADSTLITADQTFQTIASTSRVSIPIDLFDDESINVTSSIQNINDISKVFTDFSNSFTIPASKKNNETFRYWYENEVDNGFNQLIRYDGYIEIDNEIFRIGRWQLEGASVKQNKVENYKITFYGNLISLTDRFKEDKLKDIAELNDYTFDYSGDAVKNKVQNINNDDVAFPLISSEKVWQYGGGGAVVENYDITTYPIYFGDLFPALKLSKVFEAIETKYGVSFNGNFLTQSRFKDAYLWFKNKEKFVPLGEKKLIQFTNITNAPGARLQVFQDFHVIVPSAVIVGNTAFQFATALILNFSSITNWQITFLKDGQEVAVLSGFGNSASVNTSYTDGTYTTYLRTSSPVTYTGVLNSITSYFFVPTNINVYTSAQIITGNTTSNLDLPSFAPDIKVTDFFSSVLKMFNLTAFSFDETNYTLEQLENWYYQGNIKDFTQYCVTDLDFERIKPYKKVTFQYEKSESLMNRAYNDNNQKEYGDLSYPFNSDGSDYNIKLAFENMLFNKFTNTNLQVGYAINKDLKPYQTKPIILYKTENTSASFKFNNGSATTTVNNYNVFGQDVNYQGNKHSLNWGVEISSYYLETINNGLFNDYYFDYLNNLYSLKSRMVKAQMRLPYSELLNLRLNDRIVIRDKRYVINSFTTNLKTFEVKMELIQDFRSINFNNTTGRTIDPSSQTLRFDTTSNEPLTWEILNDPDGQIISINNYDSYVEVETKANTSGIEKVYSITSNTNGIIVITQNG
jgi:hypothetical protein